jgi:hypothetical protein
MKTCNRYEAALGANGTRDVRAAIGALEASTG